MNSRSMFFRCFCLLPGGFRLKQERFNKGWMLAGDISRVWMRRCGGRDGISVRFTFTVPGLAAAEPRNRRFRMRQPVALSHIADKFNVAEVDRVQVSSYPGFRIARVTARACQIAKLS